MSPRERTAIQAVAQRFSATWESSNDAGACLTLAGKRISLEIATLPPRPHHARAVKPRLRFDKVATRLIEGLQTALFETVRDGTTVLLTITAPILLPAKTSAALAERIQTLLHRPSPRRDWKDTIHGNTVHIQIVHAESKQAPKLMGFVHNPGTRPLLLLDMTRDLLHLLSAGAAPTAAPKLAGQRWLVIRAESSSLLEAYRYIYSQLHIATGFKKVLLLFSDATVETLAD